MRRPVIDQLAEADVEFQKLYRDYFSLIFRHACYLLGGNAQVAEEITQDTFVKLYTSPPLQREKLAAWLLKVSSNLAYNYLKSDKQRTAREKRVGSANYEMRLPDLPEDICIRNQQVIAVKDVLDTLGERDKMCLLLKFSGFRYSEIAEIAGIPANSVGTVLARAQSRFRQKFLSRNGGEI